MMYKTIWSIFDETTGIKSVFTYYHFGKKPLLPSWYCEENHIYEIEMLWNLKLVVTPEAFSKCLFHQYSAKRG